MDLAYSYGCVAIAGAIKWVPAPAAHRCVNGLALLADVAVRERIPPQADTEVDRLRAMKRAEHRQGNQAPSKRSGRTWHRHERITYPLSSHDQHPHYALSADHLARYVCHNSWCRSRVRECDARVRACCPCSGSWIGLPRKALLRVRGHMIAATKPRVPPDGPTKSPAAAM